MIEKNKNINVRYETPEYNNILRRAKRAGKSISAYIRYMVDKGERCQCQKDVRKVNVSTLDW